MRNNEYRVWVTGDEHAKDGFYYINFGDWISEFASRILYFNNKRIDMELIWDMAKRKFPNDETRQAYFIKKYEQLRYYHKPHKIAYKMAYYVTRNNLAWK